MPPKKVAKKAPTGLTYTDVDGSEKVLALGKIKSFADTDWFAEAGTLYPQLGEDRQAVLSKTADSFDEDGRPSLTGRNFVILSVHHMTKGDFGPWYLMHVLVEGDPETDSFAGEWTLPTRGTAVNEAVEALSGVSIDSGKRIAPGELPVALRVEFAAGEGAYEGYYYPTAPIESAEATPVG